MTAGTVSYDVVRASDMCYVGFVNLTMSQLAQAERLKRDRTTITRASLSDVLDPLSLERPITLQPAARPVTISDETPLIIVC